MIRTFTHLFHIIFTTNIHLNLTCVQEVVSKKIKAVLKVHSTLLKVYLQNGIKLTKKERNSNEKENVLHFIFKTKH